MLFYKSNNSFRCSPDPKSSSYCCTRLEKNRSVLFSKDKKTLVDQAVATVSSVLTASVRGKVLRNSQREREE